MVGLRIARTNSTTKHLASTYPWHFGGTFRSPGPTIGVDYLSGQAPWTFDPFELITHELASNPNVCVAGEPGMGKSGFGKSSAWWLCGAFGYRFIAIDVKGEYGGLGEALGCEHLDLRPHGRSRVNPLASDRTDVGDVERLRFVAALASILVARSLTPLEATMLNEAVSIVAAREREPLLRHVVAVISDPPAELLEALRKPLQSLHDATDSVRYALRGLITGPNAGMFDAPTNVRVDPSSPGLVIDVSSVRDDDELLQLAMLAGLRAVGQLRGPGQGRTLMFADETWRLATTLQTVRFLQHRWKLGRHDGWSNWAMLHRFADLAAQTDDGTALSKVTRGLVADSGTHVLFRHGNGTDAARTIEELKLPSTATEVLERLPMHRCLVHCGGRLAVVEARFTPRLAEIAYTNQAIQQAA